MFIPYRLYFAKKSQTWNDKGVAFLNCEKEDKPQYHSVVRLRKISESQFIDINEQEGKSWYHKILELEEKDGLKIQTILLCHPYFSFVTLRRKPKGLTFKGILPLRYRSE